jgi:hypothetical protein
LFTTVTPEANALNELEVLGFKVDHVLKTVPPNWTTFPWAVIKGKIADQELALAWLAGCLSISQAASNKPNEVPECHWRPIMANKLTSHQKCDTDCNEFYDFGPQFLKRIGQCNRELSFTDDHERIHKTMGELRQAASSHPLGEYWFSVKNACTGHSFFSTENGRVGLGPPDTEAGDVICIFYNGFTPLTVRDVGTNNDQYHFLGESYVDSLMYGEGFELETANESTMFVLRERVPSLPLGQAGGDEMSFSASCGAFQAVEEDMLDENYSLTDLIPIPL